jgi:pimeloyl-ACP methyl ester carboxylesterase
MAATVATNDQGQVALVKRPQGLLGQRQLLVLLHPNPSSQNLWDNRRSGIAANTALGVRILLPLPADFQTH